MTTLHMQRYKLIDVGPQKMNKVIDIHEQGKTCYGLEEWLCENLGYRVTAYYLEGTSVLNRTQLVIKRNHGHRNVVGHATVLRNEDATVLDMDSYRKMFERREREEMQAHTAHGLTIKELDDGA